MAEWCGKYGVEIWAWCLMPNHVHLIAVPESEEGLARAIGEAHRRYTFVSNSFQITSIAATVVVAMQWYAPIIPI